MEPQPQAPTSSQTTPMPAKPTGRRSRLLLRGESTVASVGVALAAILLFAMGATAWWLQRNQSAASAFARAQQVRTAGDLISQNAEILLTSNDLSSVRRLLSESGAAYNLSQCRIVLANGQVIASSDPSQVTGQKLPETWKRSRPLDEAAAPEASEDSLALSFPIRVSGRGEAELEVVASLADPSTGRWDAIAGVGAIGAAAMVALLITYRMMRSRIRTAGSIREALQAVEAGETSAAVLSVT